MYKLFALLMLLLLAVGQPVFAHDSGEVVLHGVVDPLVELRVDCAVLLGIVSIGSPFVETVKPLAPFYKWFTVELLGDPDTWGERKQEWFRIWAALESAEAECMERDPLPDEPKPNVLPILPTAVKKDAAEAADASEGLLRLELDTSEELPNSNCGVAYFKMGQDFDFGKVVIIYGTVEGSATLRYRRGLAGSWQQTSSSSLEDYARAAAALLGEGLFPPLTGSGLYQFELRSRHGADKFEIMESRPATYGLGFFC